MKNVYQVIREAAYNFFHPEEQGISFSPRSKRSLRWLSMHTRTSNAKQRN
jgi:hypothetical protein